MQLSEDQQAKVREWADSGMSLGDIQKSLEDEFDIAITYMEARFLVADLEVSLQDKHAEEANKDLGAGDGDAESGDATPDAGDSLAPEAGAGGVSVTLDSIARPDTMVSGKVSFSDGESAVWYITMLGELGLDTTIPGYQPTESDLVAFQTELRSAVQRAGL